MAGEAEADVEDEDDDMTPPIGCFSMLFADRSFDDERSRMLFSISTLVIFIYICRDLRLLHCTAAPEPPFHASDL